MLTARDTTATAGARQEDVTDLRLLDFAGTRAIRFSCFPRWVQHRTGTSFGRQTSAAGTPCVEGTRIGVHDVIGLIVNGAGVDEVCRSFPDLKRSQVYECLTYYEDHRAEIDDLVAGQMHDPNA